MELAEFTEAASAYAALTKIEPDNPAWGECQPKGQHAYNLIMQETDVRKQYLLREGCGSLVPQQCLADGASDAFEGASCGDILRSAICAGLSGDADRFGTCIGRPSLPMMAEWPKYV